MLSGCSNAMTAEDSLDHLRNAAWRHPELRPDRVPTPSPTDPAVRADAGATPRSPEGRFPAEYTEFALLARTNLSTTWRAYHTTLSCDVVVKELADSLLLDARARFRFQREAQIIARLTHPNIVPIRSAHFDDPPYFFTMPFVQGLHLDEHCRRHALSWEAKLRVMLEICAAMGYAHQHGVIHRDLKPPNILVDEAGQPQILDFGLGWVVDGDGALGAAPERVAAGTPPYMATEQTEGLPGDARTDVYALGVILYELIAGQRFIDTNAEIREVLRRIRECMPLALPPVAGHRTRELDAVVRKSVAKRPVDRYGSVDEFAGDLRNILADRPVRALPATRTYHVRKWLRRNRVTLAVAALVSSVVIMLLVMAATSWYRGELQSNRASVEQQARRVTMGRLQVLEQNPIWAAANLLDAVAVAEADDRLDPLLPRYALLEHHWYYPCVWGLSCAPLTSQPVQVAWTADGDAFVSVWADGQVRAWDAVTRTELTVPLDRSEHPVTLHADVAAGGVIVGCRAGSVQRLRRDQEDPSRFVSELLIPSGEAKLTHVVIAPDGQTIATAGTGRVRFYRNGADGWALAHVWHGSHEETTALALDPSSSLQIFAAFRDSVPGPGMVYSLLLYDAAQQRVLAQAPIDRLVRDIAVLPASEEVLLAGPMVLAWDWQDNVVRPVIESGEMLEEWAVRSVAWGRWGSGQIVAYAAGSGTVGFYDMTAGRHLHCQGYHDCVASDIDVAVSPKGDFVVSCARDGIRLWRLPAPQVTPAARGVAWVTLTDGPNPTWLIYRSDWTYGAEQGSARSRVIIGGAESLRTHHVGGYLTAAALSASGRFLAQVYEQEAAGSFALRLSNAADVGTSLGTIPLDDSEGAFVQWFDRSERLMHLCWQEDHLKGGANLRGRLVEARWNEESHKLTHRTVHEFDSPCTSVATDSRRRYLVACSEGPLNHPRRPPARVAVFRIAPAPPEDAALGLEYDLVTEFPCGQYVWSVALLRDEAGELVVATTGSNRRVALWTLAGEQVGFLAGHEDAIFFSARLSDRLLVTAARDHTVRIWDIWTRQELCTFRNLPGSGGPGLAVRDGRIAFTVEGGVHIVDTRDIETAIEVLREFE